MTIEEYIPAIGFAVVALFCYVTARTTKIETDIDEMLSIWVISIGIACSILEVYYLYTLIR